MIVLILGLEERDQEPASGFAIATSKEIAFKVSIGSGIDIYETYCDIRMIFLKFNFKNVKHKMCYYKCYWDKCIIGWYLAEVVRAMCDLWWQNDKLVKSQAPIVSKSEYLRKHNMNQNSELARGR